MSPAPRPLPPSEIKAKLEKHGLVLVDEDGYNWAFGLTNHAFPFIIIPNNVDFVPIDTAWQVAQLIGFNNYFEEEI